jgi:hypothetical protein
VKISFLPKERDDAEAFYSAPELLKQSTALLAHSTKKIQSSRRSVTSQRVHLSTPEDQGAYQKMELGFHACNTSISTFTITSSSSPSPLPQARLDAITMSA